MFLETFSEESDSKTLRGTISRKMKIGCCICDSKSCNEVFVVNRQKLVRCSNCGLMFFRNFKRPNYGSYDISWYEKETALFYYYQGIIADIIKKYKKTGSLFDIGAGVGILADIMMKRGWEATGIEASKKGVDYAKKKLGIELIHGDFLKATVKNKYDAVTANHVIEHMHNPNSFLKKAGSILKDNGILLLGMPNVGSIEFKVFRKRWISLVPNMHIWHFNTKTITKLLEKNNFRVIKIIVEQPKRKFSTIPKKIIGHAVHEPFRVLMNVFGTGSNMFVVAKKNENT